jgi:DNA transformation protein
MTPEALKELFKPYGEVVVKRMFGGAGIYAQGLCFAIAQDGDVFLKADAVSQPDFVAAGSSPFIYVAKGRPMPTSFWRLPAIARAEADELVCWASLGLEAARRTAAAKTEPKAKKPAKDRAKRTL